MTVSEKALGRPFLFRTFCFRSRPQDLTSDTDVVHPEEAAGRCHLLIFGVKGEKQRVCESQDPHYPLCHYTSPGMVFYTPATCRRCAQGELKSCMSGQLVARAVSLLGMIPGVLNQKQGGQIAIRQHFTTAQPQPVLLHGQATMGGLLENKMACEKCRTETKCR